MQTILRINILGNNIGQILLLVVLMAGLYHWELSELNFKWRELIKMMWFPFYFQKLCCIHLQRHILNSAKHSTLILFERMIDSFRLKIQSCKYMINKYTLTSTQITSTKVLGSLVPVFGFIAALVLELLSWKVLLINIKIKETIKKKATF